MSGSAFAEVQPGNLVPVSPCLPSAAASSRPHWTNAEGQRGAGAGGEREREGETGLILVITSVEDAVCFHWVLVVPTHFCYTTERTGSKEMLLPPPPTGGVGFLI